MMALPLPPPDIRMNHPRERDDDVYLGAARTLATAIGDLTHIERFHRRTEPLPDWGELTVLDYGCGTGRLLAGLDVLDRVPANYIGLDIQDHLIEWCQSAFSATGYCQFDTVDMRNRRYNPDGATRSTQVIPDGIEDIDLIVARSVFTHMTALDIQLCLREFRRVIADHGRAYVTVNVRTGGPAWVDNPGKPDAPPLLRVELNKSYFEYMLDDAGFSTAVYAERIENQNVYLLRPV